MVMQVEPAVDREPVKKSATTMWKRSLFSPSTASICYCGTVVTGFLCRECSESMSRALLRALGPLT